MSDDEDWDDALEEKAKEQGMSPDMARALLKMNPKLREEGKNTAWMVHSSKDANAKAAKGEKPTAPPPPSGAVAIKQGADVTGVLADLQKHLDGESKRIGDERKRLEEEKKKLDASEVALKQKALLQFTQWLVAKDPELLSPLTQQALADNKAMLDKLGFSVKYFSEIKRQLKK